MSEGINKKDKLSPREKRFVEVLATGNVSNAEAVVAAGYNPKNEQNAAVMASQLLGKDKIQNALSEAITRNYPNVPDLAANTLIDVLLNPESRVSDKIKVIELLSKVCGWQAPSKHANLNVTLREKFKLPEE
jgi:hypothetical protein